jgi:2'-5' RNA ligase
VTGNAFLAIDLSDDERHALGASLRDASPGHPVPGRRPSPANWHITLRFLGECTDAEADAVAFELERTLDSGQFDVACIGIDALPKVANAGVVYVAVDDESGSLDRLAAQCESAARDVGFSPEERPFVPHITIARLRPARDLTRLKESFGSFSVPLLIDAVTLFRSTSTRDGLRYHPIHTLRL